MWLRPCPLPFGTTMFGNLARRAHLIAPDRTYVSVEGNASPEFDPAVFDPAVFAETTFVGDERALNSRVPPDNAAAATEFSYLTTDGSDDGAAYLTGAGT